MSTPSKEQKFIAVEVLRDAAGTCLMVGDRRLAGPKPYTGQGRYLHRFSVRLSDIMEVPEVAAALRDAQAENKALREALEIIPFPAIRAISAGYIASNLEQTGTLGSVSVAAAIDWLRNVEKKLNALDAARLALAAKREEVGQ